MPAATAATHRAAGLAGVTAVAEAAALADRLDVGERAGDRFARVPQLQLAHAGRVDQDAAAGQQHELTAGRGVAAAAVGLAHFARAQHALRRSARWRSTTSRRPTIRAAPPCARVRDDRAALPSTPDASPTRRGPARPRRARATSATNAAGIVDEIGLVQDDHRRGAALPRGHEVALDPARIEVVIEAGDEKHDVDVGGDDLLLGGIAGGAAREMRSRAAARP